MDEHVLVKNLLPCVKEAGSKIIDIYNSKPNAEQKYDGSPVTTVSYTHLTLPTILLV